MKIAAKAQDCIEITQGNHYINTPVNCNNREEKILPGNSLGIVMYEFRTRTVEQVHNKYYNSMQANILAKEKGLIEKDASHHWDEYANYINKYGDKAAEVKFNESIVDLEYAVDDSLPIGRAIEVLCEVIGQSVDECEALV